MCWPELRSQHTVPRQCAPHSTTNNHHHRPRTTTSTRSPPSPPAHRPLTHHNPFPHQPGTHNHLHRPRIHPIAAPGNIATAARTCTVPHLLPFTTSILLSANHSPPPSLTFSFRHPSSRLPERPPTRPHTHGHPPQLGWQRGGPIIRRSLARSPCAAQAHLVVASNTHVSHRERSWHGQRNTSLHIEGNAARHMRNTPFSAAKGIRWRPHRD